MSDPHPRLLLPQLLRVSVRKMGVETKAKSPAKEGKDGKVAETKPSKSW